MLSLAVTVASVTAIVALVVREVTTEVSGGGGRLRGQHLHMLLELTLLAFALACYTLAVRGTHQMAGIDTRLDALYLTASTMTTLHLAIDVGFIAASAQLVNSRVGRAHRI